MKTDKKKIKKKKLTGDFVTNNTAVSFEPSIVILYSNFVNNGPRLTKTGHVKKMKMNENKGFVFSIIVND